MLGFKFDHIKFHAHELVDELEKTLLHMTCACLAVSPRSKSARKILQFLIEKRSAEYTTDRHGKIPLYYLLRSDISDAGLFEAIKY